MSSKEKGQELDALYQSLKKGQLQPLYLLSGEEEFLLWKAVTAIQQSVLAGIPADFNFQQFHARETDVQRVIEAANMLPMMAPRRLVVLRDVEAYKDAAVERLVKYVQKPSPTTVLLMVARKVDGRSKLVSSARKTGMVLEFKTLWEQQIKTWLRGEVTRLRKRMSDECLDFMVDLVGENLRELHSELTKVALFVGERDEIRLDDLRAVVADISIDTVFEFARAVGAGEPEEALMQLRRLLEHDGEGGATRQIIMLHRHFQQLYRARLALDAGLSPKESAREAGVYENMYWKWEKETLPHMRDRSALELERCLLRLFEVAVEMRSSRAPSPVLFESLVIELSRARRGRTVA